MAFKIKKAVLSANDNATNLEENSMKFSQTELAKKKFRLNNNGKGINFFDADDSFYAYARFSKRVTAALKNKTLDLAQLFKFGTLVQYETQINGEDATLYTLAIPEEMRGGDMLNVADAIKKAAPIQKKAATLEDISKMLSA